MEKGGGGATGIHAQARYTYENQINIIRWWWQQI